MKNTIIYVLTILSLGLSDDAFSADASGQEKIQYKDNGGYEDKRHVEQTAAGGTKHTADADVNVDIDSKGLATKTVKTKNIDDPVGLMNKQTDTTKSVAKEKARGGFEENISHNHTDAAGANTKEEVDNNVDVDEHGTVTQNMKSTKTVDPKGMFNKKTTTTTKMKAVNGQVVDQSEEKQ